MYVYNENNLSLFADTSQILTLTEHGECQLFQCHMVLHVYQIEQTYVIRILM